jgi:hypothetical protein
MEIFAIEKEKNDNLHDISSYEPAVIANKIKKECMQQNTTLKTMLQELFAKYLEINGYCMMSLIRCAIPINLKQL